MKDERKKKLMQLGADSLSDALLDMAKSLDQVDDRVNQMVSTQEENIRAFKKKLSSLKRSTKFIDWRQSSDLADSLSQLLDELQACAPDPCLGVELVTAFYETDDSVFERSDDSNGSIGEVYVYDAKELFVLYASSCEDNEKIASLILRLCQKDDYSVRTSLMDSVGLFLEEPVIRDMVEKLQLIAAEQQEEYEKYHYYSILVSFVRQIKDAPLFEKTRLSIQGETPLAIIEIAKVYLDCGEVETALSWILKKPEGSLRFNDEYTKVLTEIYTKQGDTEGLAALLKKKFRALPSMGTLQELLNIIGDDAKEAFIDEEVEHILHDTMLRLNNLSFLLDCGKYDDAQTYLFARAADLDGILYETLLPLARTFDKQARYLATSLIYRSLLDSILERAYTKSYPYGVRYLHKMDSLAPLIPDWLSFADHAAYKESLLQIHGRKKSFWGQYGKK